ncbi:MAG: redoxin domain-containing protein [Cytophagales bacterium]|jgi:peroxiredoxin|nr:redoxin domain-containing protein [Cytophagales bacterium]
MKTSLMFLAVSIATTTACTRNADFTATPAKPRPGDTVAVTFRPSPPLDSLAELEAVAFLFTDTEEPVAQEVALRKDASGWMGRVVTQANTQSFAIRFFEAKVPYREQYARPAEHPAEVRYTPLHDKGGKPVAGAYGSLAAGLHSWGESLGLQAPENALHSRRDSLLRFLAREFTAYPKNKLKFFASYCAIAKLSGQDVAKLRREANQLAANSGTNLPEKDLLALSSTFEVLLDEPKSRYYKNLALKKYPKGEQAEQTRLEAVYAESDLTKKETLLKRFQADFPNYEGIDWRYYDLLMGLYKAGRWADFKRIAAKRPFNNTLSSAYQEIALELTKQGRNLELAAELARQAAEYDKANVTNPRDRKSPSMPDREWAEERRLTYAFSAGTYAWVLYKQGKYAEASPWMKESMALNRNYIEMNEVYAQILEKNAEIENPATGGNALLRTELESFLKAGKSTKAMRRQLAALYAREKGRPDSLSVYEADLEKKHRETEYVALRKQMLDKPAPAFSLVNLEGKPVSLSDFRGKTVIVDFWATWCGPCVESFPAMQQAVNHFKNRSDVQFLFISTREDPKTQKQKVKKLMDKHKYTFTVLLDSNNKVSEAYQVNAYPTQFVIDKNGVVRFKNEGAHTEAEPLIEELAALIELADEAK